MVTVIVVIVNPIGYQSKEVVVIVAGSQIQFILHMPKEALLRCVVPTVGFSGHGLAQMIVLNDLDEFQAGVMGALIAIDQGFRMQRNAMVFNQLIHRIKDKINFRDWLTS